MTAEKAFLNLLVMYALWDFSRTVVPFLWQSSPVHLFTLPLLILTALLFIWGALR